MEHLKRPAYLLLLWPPLHLLLPQQLLVHLDEMVIQLASFHVLLALGQMRWNKKRTTMLLIRRRMTASMCTTIVIIAYFAAIGKLWEEQHKSGVIFSGEGDAPVRATPTNTAPRYKSTTPSPAGGSHTNT